MAIRFHPYGVKKQAEPDLDDVGQVNAATTLVVIEAREQALDLFHLPRNAHL